MADLDDFFAKKDRKKPKGKKFLTTEEVAKKLEETGKRVVEKPKLKEKPTNNPEDEEGTQKPEEEEEWREFTEEKKDYTGLKIGNLQVNDNFDGDSDDEQGTGENNSETESGEGGSKASGPWKKKDGGAQQENTETTATTPAAPVTTPAAPAAPQVYRAPHFARSMAASSSSSRGRAKNIAPDIRSEEYFPTLSAKQGGQPETTAWGRRKRDEGTFEEVRNRGASRGLSLQESQPQPAKLSLDNKYGALSQDQS